MRFCVVVIIGLLVTVFVSGRPFFKKTLWASATETEASEQTKSWTAYQNKRLGFSLYYPTDWFTPDAETVGLTGRSFSTPDGKARIATFGMLDAKWLGAELYDKKRIIADGRVDDELAVGLYPGPLREQGEAYSSVDSKQVTKNSITIRGKRGDQAYLEKYIFTCKDKVVSALSYTYPIAEAKKYETIIKKLLKRFGAGSGADTPVCN